MSPRSRAVSFFVNAGKVMLLTGFLFVVVSTAMGVTGVVEDPTLADQSGGEAGANTGSIPPQQADQGRVALIFLAVCFAQALVLSIAILRSRWWGWRLVAAVLTVMAVVTAVLSHIDSLFFLRDVSPGFIARLALASILTAAVFAPVAVWVLGRFRRDGDEPAPFATWPKGIKHWVAILLALAVFHIVTYFAFGYYVAWQSPEVRSFYGGEDPGSFWLQMVSVVRDTPWLMPVQVVRGVLWGLRAVVLGAGLKGPRWSVALITGGVFVGLFALPLVIPNPMMPEAVRQAHLLETVLSRGLYGFVGVWILGSRLFPARAELGAAGA